MRAYAKVNIIKEYENFSRFAKISPCYRAKMLSIWFMSFLASFQVQAQVQITIISKHPS